MTLPPIGVSPPSALATRPRLFGALSQALDVRFVGADAGRQQPATTVYFGEDPVDITAPSLVLGTGAGAVVDESRVRFTRSESLDAHLRGWSISDATVPGVPGLAADRRAIGLAEVGGSPVWTTQTRAGGRLDHAIVMPEELDQGETLRSRLVPGEFFGLLPLVEFIRSLDRAAGWCRPPVHASFLMDDPNLHAVRYGYLDFERLASDGADIGFHLAVAMIPIDGWFNSPKASSIFRTHQDSLSLLMHGNNHTQHELGDGRAAEPRLEMIAQALRRVQRFEARSGVPVARVMAAPHGECSEEVARDMSRLGVESLSITRPFPWLEHPPADMPLAGWFPADTSSPLPVLERMPLTRESEELPLRAFLGQPIILYGHHWDLGADPGLLVDWTEQVSRLGEVSWASVGDISRGLVSWRSDGETLSVRPHTRRVDIRVPPGVSKLRVEGGGVGYESAVVRAGPGATTVVSLLDGGGEVSIPHGTTSVHVQMQSGAVIDPEQIGNPRWTPWPITRRLLSEARDRTRPWVDARRQR
jgi:hypothetical protein